MPFARRCDPGGAQPEVEGAGKAMEDEGVILMNTLLPFARRCDPGGAQPEVEGAGKAMEDEGAILMNTALRAAGEERDCDERLRRAAVTQDRDPCPLPVAVTQAERSPKSKAPGELWRTKALVLKAPTARRCLIMHRSLLRGTRLVCRARSRSGVQFAAYGLRHGLAAHL